MFFLPLRRFLSSKEHTLYLLQIKIIAKIVDVSTAMTRAVAVLGATLLVFIALKDKKGDRIQSTMDRNPIVGGCQESERQPVRKDVVAKIIRFLKNFF